MKFTFRQFVSNEIKQKQSKELDAEATKTPAAAKQNCKWDKSDSDKSSSDSSPDDSPKVVQKMFMFLNSVVIKSIQK